MLARIKAFFAKLWYGPPEAAEPAVPPPHPTVPVPSKDPYLPGPWDRVGAAEYKADCTKADCKKDECKKDECKKPVVPARAAACGSSCGTPATHYDNGPDLMTTLLVTSVIMDTPAHATAAVTIPDPTPTYSAPTVEMVEAPAPSYSPPAVTFSEPAPSYSAPASDYGGGSDYSSSGSSDFGGGGDF